MANYNSSHTGAEIDSAVGRTKDTVVTAGTVAASSAVVVDANKDISGFRNVTLTGQIQAATINLTGDTTIGDGDTDNITINADVNSNIIPNTDNTFDLGSASKQWKDIYVNGIGYIDQLGTDADPIAIYASSGEIDGTAIGSESASTGAFTTISASGNVDFNGDLDVDGTTNLDVVDIDGAVNISSDSVPQLTIGGSTPTIYLGDSGAEDTKLVFRGNATDVYLALDDSADNFLIGQGTTVGGDTRITLDPATGNTTFAGDLTVPHKIIHDGDTDTYIRYLTDNIVLYTGGAQRLDVNSSRVYITDSVGVGTSSPSAGAVGGKVLHVQNSGATASVRVDRSDASTAGTLSITSGNTSNSLFSTGSKDLTIATNSTTALTIDSSQRVGIGESSSLDALLVIKGNSDANTTPSIRLKDGSDTREAWISNTAGDLVLANGGNDNVPHCVLKMFDGNIMQFSTANTERMRITSDGRLGINVTSPNSFLHVKAADGDADNNYVALFQNLETTNDRSKGILVQAGTTTDDWALHMEDHDGSNTLMRVTGAGDVGIGDISPSTALTSFGSASKGLSIKNAQPTIALTDTDATGAFWIANVGGQSYLQNNVSGSVFRFLTSGGEKLRILNGGGITFNGDTATANALDDYEEGTITPILHNESGGSSPTQLYNARGGFYTKIGNRVFFSIRIEMNGSGVSSGSGNISIGGLPFTVSNDVNNYGAVSVGYTFGWGTGQHGAPTSGFFSINTTNIFLRVYDNDAGNVSESVYADGADVTNGTTITVSGHYIV